MQCDKAILDWRKQQMIDCSMDVVGLSSSKPPCPVNIVPYTSILTIQGFIKRRGNMFEFRIHILTELSLAPLSPSFFEYFYNRLSVNTHSYHVYTYS